MTNKFTAQQKVGEIVAQFPKAADIFKEYKIDFCCGGDRQLSEAIKEQNLNQEEILAKINSLYQEMKDQVRTEVDWTKESLSRLIDYVVNRHHAYLQVELPKISELTTKILRVHGAHHPELAKVHKLFHNLKTELEQHLIKEEEIEFPLIKDYEQNPSEEKRKALIQAIQELEEEHEGAGTILKELRKITKDYSVPEDGCNSYRLTYNKLQELESDTFAHIHLENNILFPRLISGK